METSLLPRPLLVQASKGSGKSKDYKDSKKKRKCSKSKKSVPIESLPGTGQENLNDTFAQTVPVPLDVEPFTGLTSTEKQIALTGGDLKLKILPVSQLLQPCLNTITGY